MLKVTFRLPRYAPAALVFFAAFLLAGEARAQCDVNNPKMVCSLETCLALEEDVKAPDSCSTQESPLSGCNKVFGCENLLKARERWRKCARSRETINRICFNYSSDTHNTKAGEALSNVANCTAKIQLPRPRGCGEDPCPDPL